ncbi:Hypp5601 [Branchiostoma lanceolatum]|uniref:Hypp5601 protein n=1 Tax=Branchiostoma lanceolatum TaxID=7740 RepID=A0A8J9VIV8_BRALA|nr:Hypp5601 [Branchiostoma lanceolatum]
MSLLQRSKERGDVRKSPRGLLSVWGPSSSFPPPAPTAAPPKTGRERAATLPMHVRGQSLPLHTVEDALFRKHVSLLPAISYNLPESTGKPGYYPNVWASIRLQKSSDYIVQDSSQDVRKISPRATSPFLRKIYAKSAPPQDTKFAALRTYTPRREGTRTGSMSVDREIKRVFHNFDLKDVDVDNIKGLKDRLAIEQRQLVLQAPPTDVNASRGTNKPQIPRQPVVHLAEEEETAEIRRNNVKVETWLKKHFDYNKAWDDFS